MKVLYILGMAALVGASTTMMGKKITHLEVKRGVERVHILPYQGLAARTLAGTIAQSPGVTLVAYRGWPPSKFKLNNPIDLQPSGAGGRTAAVTILVDGKRDHFESNEIDNLPENVTLSIDKQGIRLY